MTELTGNCASGISAHRFRIQTKKKRDQEGDEGLALLADRLPGDAVPDEVVEDLRDHLELARHQLRLRERGPEEGEDDHRADQGQQHRLVEVDRADAEDRVEQERPHARSRETAILEEVAVGLEGEQLVTTHRELLRYDA